MNLENSRERDRTLSGKTSTTGTLPESVIQLSHHSSFIPLILHTTHMSSRFIYLQKHNKKINII